jgi:hypothetical protein
MDNETQRTLGRWRDGAGFAMLEVALFVALFIAAGFIDLPVSNTPWFFLLGSLMLLVRGKFWGEVGLRWPRQGLAAIALAALAGVALSVNELLVLEPAVRSFTGSSPDLSFFSELRGNLKATLFWIGLSWVLAAFGEETVWRGYALNRFAAMFGSTRTGWIIAAIVVNVGFGLIHQYQDVTGIIVTGIGGLTYTALYFLAGRNLVVPIVAHGMQNTCDFLFLYHGGIIPGA